MQRVVLYGAGSPIIVDVEESCLRRGLAIAAVVKNVEGEVFTTFPGLVVPLAEMGPGLLELPLIFPLVSPAHRKFAWEQAMNLGASRFDALLDPTAIVPASLELGEGVYVNAGVTIGGASRLERFVFVNRGVSLGHHAVAGEFASFGPGVVIAGQVRIGRGAFIGAGAVVLPRLSIGDNAVVGAGAVVTRDVPAHSLVVGNPARVIQQGIGGYNGKGV